MLAGRGYDESIFCNFQSETIKKFTYQLAVVVRLGDEIFKPSTSEKSDWLRIIKPVWPQMTGRLIMTLLVLYCAVRNVDSMLIVDLIYRMRNGNRYGHKLSHPTLPRCHSLLRTNDPLSHCFSSNSRKTPETSLDSQKKDDLWAPYNRLKKHELGVSRLSQ